MKRCSAAELMSESSTTRPSLSHSQNGLSADQQQREEQRENCKVCTPLHWGLKQQFPGYEVRQHNITIDARGGVVMGSVPDCRGQKKRGAKNNSEGSAVGHDQ